MNKPIVYVTWLDAVGCAQGWDEGMKLKAKYGELVHTIGFLIDENNEFLLIAGHMGKDQHQGCMAIPKDMIRTWEEVVWVAT